MSAQPGVEYPSTQYQMKQDAETWRKTAEEMLKRMPPPSIPALPDEHASDISRYKNRPEMTTAEAWQKCAEAIEQHDADACKAHREEIDTLLVFAGLFSAVLTAFAIESYSWLQDDPNDAIISLLSQIAHAQNSTHTAPAPAGLPDAISARINAYWFLSLTLSLSAALVAILCKQWIREFERRPSQSHREYISIRQMKLEGFEGWGVASIVTTIPLLLQSALGLFALGLIELLWNLHATVAIVVLIPAAAALVFYALTTLLPAVQLTFYLFGPLHSISQCPFKSPQSMLALRMLKPLSRRLNALVSHDFQMYFGNFHTWATFDINFNDERDFRLTQTYPDNATSWAVPGTVVSCFRGLAWLCDNIDQQGIQRIIWLAIWDIVTGVPADSTDVKGIWSLHTGILRIRSRLTQPWFDIGTPYRRYRLTESKRSELLVDAIILAYDLAFDPALLEELFIQHWYIIDLAHLCARFKTSAETRDAGSEHSLLRAILTRTVSEASPCSSTTAVPEFDHPRFTFGTVHDLTVDPLDTYELWPTLRPEELCCIIALSFQTLHLSQVGVHPPKYEEGRRLRTIVESALAYPDRAEREEVETALGALSTLVPALGRDDGLTRLVTAGKDKVRISSSPALKRFNDNIQLLARVHGEIRAREAESREASNRITAGPSSERRSDIPRGDQADIPEIRVEETSAGPAVPSKSGTATPHADDPPGALQDQSVQATDNHLGAAEDWDRASGTSR